MAVCSSACSHYARASRGKAISSDFSPASPPRGGCFPAGESCLGENRGVTTGSARRDEWDGLPLVEVAIVQAAPSSLLPHPAPTAVPSLHASPHCSPQPTSSRQHTPQNRKTTRALDHSWVRHPRRVSFHRDSQ